VVEAQRRRGGEALSADSRARSVEEMLCDVGIQLVAIATPSYSHYELAQQCLREQRHVVIDKPFALKSEEAAELIRMARERKLVLAPFQNRRWDGITNSAPGDRERGAGAAGDVRVALRSLSAAAAS